MLAFKAERRPVLEGRPNGLHCPDVLANTWRRRCPRHAEAALAVRLHLRPETKYEPSAAEPLKVPRKHRRNHWTARKRDRDRGVHLEPGGMFRGDDASEEWIVCALRELHRIEAKPFGSFSDRGGG